MVLTSRRLSGCTQTVRACVSIFIFRCREGKVARHTLVRHIAIRARPFLPKTHPLMRLPLQPLPHKAVHSTQPVQHRRVILLVERQRCQAHLQQRPHAIALPALAIMLLARLQKARVVDARVPLQLVRLLGDLVQLRQHIIKHFLALLLAHAGLGFLLHLPVLGRLHTQRLELPLTCRGLVLQFC